MFVSNLGRKIIPKYDLIVDLFHDYYISYRLINQFEKQKKIVLTKFPEQSHGKFYKLPNQTSVLPYRGY